MTSRGKIHIDDGAAKALKGGSSLLPAGAISVSGSFRRGDVVDIMCNGAPIARGLSEYDAVDASQICKKRTADLEKILGEVARNVLVHRDQMVLI